MLWCVPMKRIFTIALFTALVSHCAAEIGDECQYDNECSPNMDRNCDNSQPGGYCLIIGCGPDECPSEASCVEFTTPCPTGQGYEEQTIRGTDAQTVTDAGTVDGGTAPGADFDKCRLIEPNRGRTYCLKHCKSGKDCRSKYVCKSVKKLSAAIIDFDDNRTKVCVPEE